MSISELDEVERGEALRSWLRRHGGALLGGVLAGVAILIGIELWQQRREALREQAALDFESFLAAEEAKDFERADQLAAELASGEGGSYAWLALQRQARRALDAGRPEEALARLREAQRFARDPAAAELGRLRVARVLLALGRPEEALAELDRVRGEAWRAELEELRGDALARLGRDREAREAYLRAQAARPSPGEALAFKLAALAAGGESE